MTPGLDGLFWMKHYAIPELRKPKGASIVNIYEGWCDARAADQRRADLRLRRPGAGPDGSSQIL